MSFQNRVTCLIAKITKGKVISLICSKLSVARCFSPFAGPSSWYFLNNLHLNSTIKACPLWPAIRVHGQWAAYLSPLEAVARLGGVGGISLLVFKWYHWATAVLEGTASNNEPARTNISNFPAIVNETPDSLGHLPIAAIALNQFEWHCNLN